MIPSSKDKISKELSYPFGAEFLSSSLEGVKQYEKFTIFFSNRFSESAAQTIKRVERGDFIELFKISFYNSPPNSYNSHTAGNYKFYGEKWEIYVHPVPSKYKSIAKEAFSNHCIQKTISWLNKERPESWYDGAHSLSFSIKLPEGEIEIGESR